MDTVYAAVKNLLKACLNLLAAVIELLVGVLNGLAALFMRLRPKMGEIRKAAEDGLASENGKAEKFALAGWKQKAESRQAKEAMQAESLVNEIRNELKEKITDKEGYYYFCSQAKEKGNGFYLLAALMILLVTQTVLAVLIFATRSSVRLFSVLLLAAVYAVVCMAVWKHKKKQFRNQLTELILEEEFKNSVWQPVQETTEQETEKATEKAEHESHVEGIKERSETEGKIYSIS